MVIYIEYNNKKLFVHKSGNFVYLSTKREGALEEMPEGYKVKYNKNGLPYVKKLN